MCGLCIYHVGVEQGREAERSGAALAIDDAPHKQPLQVVVYTIGRRAAVKQ